MDQNNMKNVELNEVITDNPLKTIFEMQKSIQEGVYGYNFKDIQSSMKSMLEFFNINYHAIQDELREYVEALGGMDTHKSALWKPWKQGHAEAGKKPFSDLTNAELKELRMEWIDLLHFIINIGIMIDMDSNKTMVYYAAKNAENIRRQKDGY